MSTGAIDDRCFLHRFALRAAILAGLHLARTRRMRTFLAVCHFVLLWDRDEILKDLLATLDARFCEFRLFQSRSSQKLPHEYPPGAVHPSSKSWIEAALRTLLGAYISQH